MEGAELYKGSPYNKASPYEYGIYSIKQRELIKSSNGNSLQNVSKGKFVAMVKETKRTHHFFSDCDSRKCK